jgi:hypothetical protein
MSNDIDLYECGLRIGNKYSSFMQSRNEREVDLHIEVMKKCCDKGEIVKMKKLYRCISTTPMSAIEKSPN